MKRPLSLSIFTGYLLIVFGISISASIVGALKSLPPYDSTGWLLVALPQLAAFAAGIALLKMLKLGAFLWGASMIAGWGIAIAKGNFFPSFGVAAIVSLLIGLASIWVLWRNWSLLRPFAASRMTAESAA